MTAPSRSESSLAKRPCASRSRSSTGSATRIQLSVVRDLRRLEPRDELRDRALDREPRRRSARASTARDSPVVVARQPRFERGRAACAIELRTRPRSRAAARRRAPASFEVRTSRVTIRAPCSRAYLGAGAQQRLRDALRGARAAGRRRAGRAHAPRSALSMRATPTAPSLVLGEEDRAARDVVARCRANPRSQVSAEALAARGPRPRTPPRARAGSPRPPRSRGGSSRTTPSRSR